MTLSLAHIASRYDFHGYDFSYPTTFMLVTLSLINDRHASKLHKEVKRIMKNP